MQCHATPAHGFTRYGVNCAHDGRGLRRRHGAMRRRAMRGAQAARRHRACARTATAASCLAEDGEMNERRRRLYSRIQAGAE